MRLQGPDFGKPASKLTLAESALLAALPKAPTRMALTHNMAGALQRQRLILNTMVEEGWITPQEQAAALANPPKLSDQEAAIDGVMGYALDYATNEVLKLAPANSPDLMVRLTIDTPLQQAGSESLRQVIRGMAQRPARARAPFWPCPRRARSGSWSAGSTITRASSTGRSRPGDSPAPASSPSSTPPPWKRGIAH